MAIKELPAPPQPESKPIEQPPWRETPLVESTKLSKAAGCRIHLKLDLLQPSGSFKSRGIGQLMLTRLANSPTPERIHFYSSSGGNAGLACVTAARALNRPATVCVPLTTKPAMIAKIEAAGAWEVIQYGEGLREADEYLKDVVIGGKRDGDAVEAVYIPPFDDPEIWKGNQTVLEEITRQMPRGVAPDAVVCSVGGGGLFNGIVQGILENSADKSRVGAGWERTQVLAVETKGADSLGTALERDEETTLQKVTSLATSLGCARVSWKCFELARRYVAEGMVKTATMSDAEAAMGCWRFADDERMMVELACGVALAVCYGGRLERFLGRKVDPEENVVIVVCGGSNVSSQILEQWRAEYGAEFENEVDQPVVRVDSHSNEVEGYPKAVDGFTTDGHVDGYVDEYEYANGISGFSNGINGFTNDISVQA
ncbi:hypothetical protein MBLNU230_g5872t1 [Neophaeotheca triangularis]